MKKEKTNKELTFKEKGSLKQKLPEFTRFDTTIYQNVLVTATTEL